MQQAWCRPTSVRFLAGDAAGRCSTRTIARRGSVYPGMTRATMRARVVSLASSGRVNGKVGISVAVVPAGRMNSDAGTAADAFERTLSPFHSNATMLAGIFRVGCTLDRRRFADPRRLGSHEHTPVSPSRAVDGRTLCRCCWNSAAPWVCRSSPVVCAPPTVTGLATRSWSATYAAIGEHALSRCDGQQQRWMLTTPAAIRRATATLSVTIKIEQRWSGFPRPPHRADRPQGWTVGLSRRRNVRRAFLTTAMAVLVGLVCTTTISKDLVHNRPRDAFVAAAATINNPAATKQRPSPTSMSEGMTRPASTRRWT